MKCNHCGGKISPGAKFCTSCGAQLLGGKPQKATPMQAPQARQAPASTRSAPPMPSRPVTATMPADQRFGLDVYHFAQPMLRLRDMYVIYDERGNEIMFAHRLLIALKRHITIYTDQGKTTELLKIMQDQVIGFIYRTFTVKVPMGETVGILRRRNMISILRRTWDVLSPGGNVIGQVREDSWGMALLRLVFRRSEMFKTDFIFEFNGQVVGKFIRKLTVGDKYLLDMTPDRSRMVDRRLAVAIGVLLDTEERR